MLSSCRREDSIRPIYPPQSIGIFSVSPTQQVSFSTGNLQYVDGQWNFSRSQYDFWSYFVNTLWDHFGWSTSATFCGMDTSTVGQDYLGVFADWGDDPSLVKSLGDGWRTLSSNEWNYLLHVRSVGGGTGKGHSYDFDTVAGVFGLLLYPDDYSDFDRVTSYAVVPDDCVFLPAAGIRMGRQMQRPFGGYYWASDYDGFNNNCAYAFVFESTVDPETNKPVYSFQPQHTIMPRSYGASVRLVRDIAK